MENQVSEIILWIASAIVTISAAIGVLVSFFRKQVTRISMDVTKTVDTEIKNSINDELQYIKGGLKSLETSIMSNQKSTDSMLLSLARDRLNQAHKLYMEEGSIDDHTMFTLEELYKEYEKLGGNGQVKVQIEQLRELYRTCSKL